MYRQNFDGWSDQRAAEAALEHSVTISFTHHESMMRVAAIGLTKIASEQGVWAATAALRILNGAEPAAIPIVSNKMWDIWVNESILAKLKIRPGRNLMRKAKRVKPLPSVETATRSE